MCRVENAAEGSLCMKRKSRSGFAVIGLGRFGMSLARALAELGTDVMVIDSDEDKLRQVRPYVQDAFHMLHITRDALEDTGIGECQTAVVCIAEKIDVSLMTTLHILTLGVPRVIAKADSVEHGIILEKIGAEVVHPERETATRLAAVLNGSKAIDLMRLNGDYVVSEIKVGRHFYGHTVRELELEKYGLKLIALEKEPDITVADVRPEQILEEDDAIVVMGRFNDADRFERKVMNRE